MVYRELEAAHASNKKEQESFEIWTVEGKMEEVLEEVIPIYKKDYPEIKFKIKAFKTDIYNEMILNAARTNSLPDMFYSWGNERLGELIDLGVVADITDATLLQLNDQIYNNVLESYTFDGKIYGLPAFGWNSVLYCNTEIFKSCGLELPTTYDELISTVKAFKKKGITPMLISGREAWMSSLYFMELALDYENIKIVEGLTNNPKYFGMEGFSKAATQFKQLIDCEPWQAGFENVTSVEATTEFIKGNGAMLVSGSWASAEIDDIIHSLVKGKVQAISFPRDSSLDDGSYIEANSQIGIAGYADGFVLNKNTDLTTADEKILFVQMMKDISNGAVINKGMGIPVYKEQSLEKTKYELLRQCQAIFPTKSYHQAYDYILDNHFVAKYSESLLEFIKGEMEAQTFIKVLVASEE